MILEPKNIYDGLIEEKKLEITVDIIGDDIIVADRETMLIVVRNLLSNAIKFTPNGGKIIIRGSNSLQEKYYQLKIFDTGTGIDKDKVKHLFNVSHQQLIGNNRSTGAGLGLTLVKEFIYLNGCTI